MYMKNITKLIGVSVFALLVTLAGSPGVARATNDTSGRSEFEIKIITQICNSFPEAWRMSSALCQSVLNPAPAPGDTTAPTISDIKIRSLRATSAEIMWQTNEYTKGGKVFYSTTSGFDANASGTSYIMEASKDTHRGHKALFATLSPDTTYYYVVRAADKSGNITLSPQGSFKTIPMGKKDNTAPVISNVTVSAVTETEAKIMWESNEATTGLVWYNTSDSAKKSSSPLFQGGYEMKHEVQLAGLTKGTTYYFVVSGTDKAGNYAVDKEGTFTTTNTSDTVNPAL